MPLHVTVLFGKPQMEIASLIARHLRDCVSASIVVGFATVEGLGALAPALVAAPQKLRSFVLGASTHRGFEALDAMIVKGVPAGNLRVHLGHSRPLGRGFQRYHPMLHSKVYLFEMPSGEAVAFIGSHNLTGFALFGQNGEASVMISGDARDGEFQAIRQHIAEAERQSVPYDPAMKAALTWWTAEFLSGMLRKVRDQQDDLERDRIVVILAAVASDRLPKKDDVIYFELPMGLGKVTSLKAKVHLYVFEKLPSTPQLALSELKKAKHNFWCQTLGIEQERGGLELQADWEVKGTRPPSLQATARPFRPKPTREMQQVRVKVWNQVFDNYEYRFDLYDGWQPTYDRSVSDALPPSSWMSSLPCAIAGVMIGAAHSAPVVARRAPTRG